MEAVFVKRSYFQQVLAIGHLKSGEMCAEPIFCLAPHGKLRQNEAQPNTLKVLWKELFYV
jgi:hypothetical protein